MTLARLAALLPCSPVDLLDLDLPLFNELVQQVQAREAEWTRRDEMAAVQVDMLHVIYRTLVQVNSAKKVHVPEFRFPRPWDGGTVDEAPVSHGAMAALMAGHV